MEQSRLNFFSTESVLERFKRPSSYFSEISTVAFKKVWLVSYSKYDILPNNRTYVYINIVDIFWQPTKTEEHISLAFSILVHGNLGQLEALMASIFRPQNIYCIYIDDKSPTEYKKAVRQLAAIYKYHFPGVSL